MKNFTSRYTNFVGFLSGSKAFEIENDMSCWFEQESQSETIRVHVLWSVRISIGHTAIRTVTHWSSTRRKLLTAKPTWIKAYVCSVLRVHRNEHVKRSNGTGSIFCATDWFLQVRVFAWLSSFFLKFEFFLGFWVYRYGASPYQPSYNR